MAQKNHLFQSSHFHFIVLALFIVFTNIIVIIVVLVIVALFAVIAFALNQLFKWRYKVAATVNDCDTDEATDVDNYNNNTNNNNNNNQKKNLSIGDITRFSLNSERLGFRQRLFVNQMSERFRKATNNSVDRIVLVCPHNETMTAELTLLVTVAQHTKPSAERHLG